MTHKWGPFCSSFSVETLPPWNIKMIWPSSSKKTFFPNLMSLWSCNEPFPDGLAKKYRSSEVPRKFNLKEERETPDSGRTSKERKPSMRRLEDGSGKAITLVMYFVFEHWILKFSILPSCFRFYDGVVKKQNDWLFFLPSLLLGTIARKLPYYQKSFNKTKWTIHLIDNLGS